MCSVSLNMTMTLKCQIMIIFENKIVDIAKYVFSDCI